MAKNTIRTYSTTAASNTDVGGVDIQGTAPASNMDDSVREIMSHLAETNAGTAPLDDTFSLCDPADATKKFRFDGGNITAGQTRVFTVPDADMVLGNIPNANDGAALGSATKSWSDLFLASGGVFNFNNGNYTVTHSAGILTFSGVIAAASTIEVGHATDTTLSRGAAGFVAVEGKRVPSPASQAQGDILVRGATEWERVAIGTFGQVPRVNSGATALEYTAVVGIDTLQATTSGTSKDFTSIPSWAKRIEISLVGVSTNGTSNIIVQIGDSGGIETSGYLGGVGNMSNNDSIDVVNPTTGFGVTAAMGATAVIHGALTLRLHDAATFTWTASWAGGFSHSTIMAAGGGSKSLSAALDRVRLTTENGTDAFDAGSVNILYS